MTIRIVFMGSPGFAVPALQAVHNHYQVAVAISQPDKPAGRGKHLQSPAVTTAAKQLGIATWQPASIRTAEFLATLVEYQADIAVVVAYGKILPPPVLQAFRLGCINVHGSLLPAYRGAAPIQWAVLNAEHQTGVSIMQLDPGMDTGPVFCRQPMDIAVGETSGQLADRMAMVGADALIAALPGIIHGTVQPEPQPDGATNARMLTKQDGAVDFSHPARLVAARVCGADPWPGAHAWLHRPDSGAAMIKLFGCTVIDHRADHRPGHILDINRSGASIVCADQTVVRISDIQLPGKKRIAFSALAAGRGIAVGDVLAIGEHLHE